MWFDIRTVERMRNRHQIVWQVFARRENSNESVEIAVIYRITNITVKPNTSICIDSPRIHINYTENDALFNFKLQSIIQEECRKLLNIGDCSSIL